jgi:hypothetical protein
MEQGTCLGSVISEWLESFGNAWQEMAIEIEHAQK